MHIQPPPHIQTISRQFKAILGITGREDKNTVDWEEALNLRAEKANLLKSR